HTSCTARSSAPSIGCPEDLEWLLHERSVHVRCKAGARGPRREQPHPSSAPKARATREGPPGGRGGPSSRPPLPVVIRRVHSTRPRAREPSVTSNLYRVGHRGERERGE